MRLKSLPPVVYDLLAVLGGVLLPFAFAPYDHAILAAVSLLMLFATWANARPGRAFLRGYGFGLAQFGLGIHWIYLSMHDYGGASPVEAGGLTALFVMFWALYPAVAGWLAVRLTAGGTVFAKIAIYPATWTLSEWLRSWFPSGFPWIQTGYTQLDTPFAGLAPLFGVYGVGWAVALVASWILVLFQLRGWWRRGAALGLVMMLGVCAKLERIPWTESAGEPFKATLLQGNIPQDMKWQPEFQRQTIEMYIDLTRKHWDSRIIIWPETSVPAFYQQVHDSFLVPLQNEARTHGTDIILGIPYYDKNQYFNSMVALGETPGVYFKRHLVPFGEYLPLRPIFGWVLEFLQIPLSDFTAGNLDQTPLVAAGYPLVASICYEDVFGQESLLGLPEAAYLVNVTNDAWFGDSAAPHQHVQMARMRALETGRWMLRATNSGVTALISPKGKLTAQAPLFERAEVSGLVTPMRGQTPYVLWGDVPIVVGLALVLGVPMLRGWLARRGSGQVGTTRPES